MQGIPLEQYQPIFSLVTDTATPNKPIPVFYIHSLEQPFCRDFNCTCHSQQKEVARLLGLVNEGIMTLREAAEFVVGLVNEGIMTLREAAEFVDGEEHG